MSDTPDIDRDRDEHAERWNDEVAAYALDALSGSELEAFTAHLADCRICAERLRWLAPAVDVLPATVAPQEPPPALKSRLMDVVNREAEMIEAAEAPNRAASGLGRASHSSGSSHASRSSRFSGFSLRPALAGLGVALVLAAGVAGYAIHDSGSQRLVRRTYEASADQPGSHATGMLEVDGDAGMLHVANLPATRRGEVYQAWIQDSGSDGGAVHPSSVFVVAEGGVGDVAIPHGLAERREGHGDPGAEGRQQAAERESRAHRRDRLKPPRPPGGAGAVDLVSPSPMATCYRHPDRETGVSCSRCGRPICPDCMTPTSVGMRCPECAGDTTPVRTASTLSGAVQATYVLIGINVVVFVMQLLTGGPSGTDGSVFSHGALCANAVGDGGICGGGGQVIQSTGGEWWRIVTSGFLHGGLIHLALNMFVLFILGQVLEPAVGTASVSSPSTS